MKPIFNLVLLLLVFSGYAQSTSKPITEFSQNDSKDAILVDVRTPEEFSAGHLDNAVNINWFDEDFTKWFEEVPKDKTIYLYCKKGGRSAKAQEKLKSLGFSNTVDLEGGYDAWSKTDH